jgi:hypothetical protein
MVRVQVVLAAELHATVSPVFGKSDSHAHVGFDRSTANPRIVAGVAASVKVTAVPGATGPVVVALVVSVLDRRTKSR